MIRAIWKLLVDVNRKLDLLMKALEVQDVEEA